MKKALCLALAAALLALAACAAPPAESMESTSAPAAQAGEGETDHIRQLLEACGVKPETTLFESWYDVTLLDGLTVYSSDEAGGGVALLAERPDGTAFYTTVPYTLSVNGVYLDEEGMLCVYTDGLVHGGDEIMHNGPGLAKIDPATGALVSQVSEELLYPQGVYGRECSAEDDHYTFGECTVGEDAVTFTFLPAEENAFWTGTELYFLPVWNNDADGERRMAVLFNNTAAPDPALAQQLETLPGVLEAAFTEVDSPYYAGTLLEIRLDDKYTLAHSFNGGVPGTGLESYTIRCKDLYPDGAPVVGDFVPDPEMEAEIAQKEQEALKQLGMLDPTSAPESAGEN